MTQIGETINLVEMKSMSWMEQDITLIWDTCMMMV